MKFLTASSFVLSALLLGFSKTPAKAYTIDLFDDVDGTQLVEDDTADGNPIIEIDSSLDYVLGGTRELSVNMVSGSRTVSGDISTADSLFIFSAGGGTAGDFELVWNNFSDLNLTDDDGTTQDAFEVFVEYSDKDVFIEFEILDGVTSTKWGQTIVQDTEQEIIDFPFSNFNNSVLQSADSITLRSVGADPRLDLELSYLNTRAVPFEFSPALGIFIGISFIGFQLLRRRVQKNVKL